jgi:hypothetical protein
MHPSLSNARNECEELFYAACEGKSARVTRLLAGGACVDAQNNVGRRARGGSIAS